MSAIRIPRPASSFLLVFLFLVLPGSLASPRSHDPSLAVTVAAPIELKATQGGEAVRSHLEFTNTGTAKMEWRTSSNQAWLKFDPSSGSLSPRASASIAVVADPTGFAPGTYVAAAKISGPQAVPQTLEVTMIEQPAFTEAPITNAQRTFPPDSGMVNVRARYGAKGDGLSDDTEAIQQAISATVHHTGTRPRIVYFPAGTYLVSRPLLEKDLTGHWNSLLTLQGENRATTTLKLRDNNPLYQSASDPTPVLKFASQNGGRKGGGNSGFDNNMFDMTIDVGRGNPGAVALGFIGNNYCALRNVTLQSSDPNHSGAIGLALLRYATGPCLIKDVVINGFDYGIKAANNEYSNTFEDLTLLNQKVYGIYNANNVLSIRHLFSTNSVPAVFNENAAGLVTLVGGILRDGSAHCSAIQNHGTLYARNVGSSGYTSVLEGLPGTSISEYNSGPAFTQFGGQASSLNLPVEETPYFEDMSLSNWKSVIAFGADPTGRLDSSAAIQRAIDSGAATVYFPTGVYLAKRTILVRGKVRMLKGFDSSLNPSGDVFTRSESPAPLFEIAAGAGDVTLDHFRIGAFSPYPTPGVIFIQQDSARSLVLRDSIIGAQPTTVAYQNTSQGTGTLFVENVAAQPWKILYPQEVFSRQINPEGNKTKIINKGGKLWILGLKTEGAGTNIETKQGGHTEVLGGLIYPVWKTDPAAASFVVTDSHASFIYAVSNYKPPTDGTNFAIQIQETQHGVAKSLLTSKLPARGLGTMIPLYSSGDPSPDAKMRNMAPAVSH